MKRGPSRSSDLPSFRFLLSEACFEKFTKIKYPYFQSGMGGCPMICSDPGPANPRDWDRDVYSKPRSSRDREKNLRDSPATKPIYVRTRGTRVTICPGAFCVPWDRDRSLRDERDRDKISRYCPEWFSSGTSGTGTKNRGTVPSRPLLIPGFSV